MTQPGQLRNVLAAAGKRGALHVIYQPKSGDIVTHWELMAWLCIKRGNLILMGDEIDRICSAGAAKNGASPYWKTARQGPALDHIVQYGRHSPLAFVGIARAPQDVWRRLTGQSNRIIVFTMTEEVELAAVRGRLGSNTDRLPTLGKYEYLDWRDGEDVRVCGGAS